MDDIRAKVRAALKNAEVKTAAAEVLPPPPPGQPKVEGLNTTQTRQIPKGHKFDPKSLKPLARMLWAMSVGLGHTLQAYRTFNRVKSSSISPDGMLGGRGYVLKVSDLRQKLYDACEALSVVSDTIHDEINAPHWKPQLAELDEEDFNAIDRLLGESEENLENPEEEAEESEKEVEKKGKPSKNWPPKGKDDDAGAEEPSSELPTGGNSEVVQKARKKEASESLSLADRVARRASTLPLTDLSGPRITDLDPGDTQEVSDYPDRWADSSLPTDSSPSEAHDFGIGYGAAGKGIDVREAPVSNLPEGVAANSGLPGDNTSAPAEFDKDLMDVGYRYERQDQPNSNDLERK